MSRRRRPPSRRRGAESLAVELARAVTKIATRRGVGDEELERALATVIAGRRGVIEPGVVTVRVEITDDTRATDVEAER